jgi:hypothetical protein
MAGERHCKILLFICTVKVYGMTYILQILTLEDGFGFRLEWILR